MFSNSKSLIYFSCLATSAVDIILLANFSGTGSGSKPCSTLCSFVFWNVDASSADFNISLCCFIIPSF